MRLAVAAQLAGALLLCVAVAVLAGLWWSALLGGAALLTAGTLAERADR